MARLERAKVAEVADGGEVGERRVGMKIEEDDGENVRGVPRQQSQE